MAGRQQALTAVDAKVEPIEGVVTSASPHVLHLGEEEFACEGKVPFGKLIRYAANDLLGIHHILVDLVPERDHERMWDAMDDMAIEDIGEAVKDLLATYTDRPTRSPSSSRGGRKRTGRS